MTNDTTPPGRLTPPVGEFQEIDGRRLFVHRSGSGGPAVVFLPGASAVGLDYFHLQQQVARSTTAVVYDRGGTGYSDPLPLPRSAAAVATELHDLLHAQDIAAPYVLVAHSLGGAYAHRFAQLYPREVAGLVWVDAFHRDWDEFLPSELSLAAGEQMAPELEQIRQLRPALREMGEKLFAEHPGHVRQALVDAHVSDEWIRVGFVERGNMAMLADELRAGPDLPDVPLIALTAGGVDAADEAMLTEHLELVRKARAGRVRLDATVVSRVSHGEQRILSDAGHTFLISDHADAVVQAIRDVVDLGGARLARRPPRTPQGETPHAYFHHARADPGHAGHRGCAGADRRERTARHGGAGRAHRQREQNRLEGRREDRGRLLGRRTVDQDEQAG
ncbi:pimeloyl-ACP methyl ester carboxylesterase [Prauserella shujinwangii]|uniref:Pimeloyl-ACP methyl ester carboxylesterase n=1 Tax=Prauserella shujinwangii TaxID=1453103 RepID=A0A2T0M1I4_9PSEU|nr:alpha/beta hydrolase [Prauserella shujinwangii]PRX50448.1 pimeloyl-ACP methyl ester carboxylesterase [Prauserella shujinwangii]